MRAGFDVVGVVGHVDDFIAAVAERTGWRASLAGTPAQELNAARNALSYDGDNERWRPDRLTAGETAAIKQYTACDAAVYAAAAERAASLDSVGSLELAPVGEADAGEEASASRRRATIAELRQRRAQAAAAYLAPESPPSCALLIFYHVAKTGGSYVRSLMQASRAAGDWAVRALRRLRCMHCTDAIRCTQFEEPTDFRDVTWPFLRNVALAGTADGVDNGACDAIRKRGRLLAEVHANAVRARSAWQARAVAELRFAQGFALWVRSVEPHLPELRRRYAACGCGFTTATMLRCVRADAV
jgi:hypothetical protein